MPHAAMDVGALRMLIIGLKHREEVSLANDIEKRYLDQITDAPGSKPLALTWQDRYLVPDLIKEYLPSTGMQPQQSEFPELPAGAACTLPGTKSIKATRMLKNGKPVPHVTDKVDLSSVLLETYHQRNQGPVFHSALMETIQNEPELQNVSGTAMEWMAMTFNRTVLKDDIARIAIKESEESSTEPPYHLLSPHDRKCIKIWLNQCPSENESLLEPLKATYHNGAEISEALMCYFLGCLAQETLSKVLTISFSQTLRMEPGDERNDIMQKLAADAGVTQATTKQFHNLLIPEIRDGRWRVWVYDTVKAELIGIGVDATYDASAGALRTFFRLLLGESNDVEVRRLPHSQQVESSGAVVCLNTVTWLAGRVCQDGRETLHREQIVAFSRWILLCVAWKNIEYFTPRLRNVVPSFECNDLPRNASIWTNQTPQEYNGGNQSEEIVERKDAARDGSGGESDDDEYESLDEDD